MLSSRISCRCTRMRCQTMIRLRQGCRESRRCSRDTYPESHITKYASIRRVKVWCCRGRASTLSSSVCLSSLELGDSKVYEPQIRALLGTVSHFVVRRIKVWFGRGRASTSARRCLPTRPRASASPPRCLPSGNTLNLEMCSGSEAGSYLRLIDSCITQLKAQGPSRTCNESKEEEAAGHVEFGFLFVHSSLTALTEFTWGRNSVPRRNDTCRRFPPKVRERECVCVCVRERACVRESVCVCVCVTQRERERERERERVCVREKQCVCVCVTERDRRVASSLGGSHQRSAAPPVLVVHRRPCTETKNQTPLETDRNQKPNSIWFRTRNPTPLETDRQPAWLVSG